VPLPGRPFRGESASPAPPAPPAPTFGLESWHAGEALRLAHSTPICASSRISGHRTTAALPIDMASSACVTSAQNDFNGRRTGGNSRDGEAPSTRPSDPPEPKLVSARLTKIKARRDEITPTVPSMHGSVRLIACPPSISSAMSHLLPSVEWPWRAPNSTPKCHSFSRNLSLANVRCSLLRGNPSRHSRTPSVHTRRRTSNPDLLRPWSISLVRLKRLHAERDQVIHGLWLPKDVKTYFDHRPVGPHRHGDRAQRARRQPGVPVRSSSEVPDRLLARGIREHPSVLVVVRAASGHGRTSCATQSPPSHSPKRSSDQPRSCTRRCHSAPSIVANKRSRHSCSVTPSRPVAAAARA
jgi:hypothetical protein